MTKEELTQMIKTVRQLEKDLDTIQSQLLNALHSAKQSTNDTYWLLWGFEP
jgi:uncharacterized protein Yka (UPF0111/DUF47 family)